MGLSTGGGYGGNSGEKGDSGNGGSRADGGIIVAMMAGNANAGWVGT